MISFEKHSEHIAVTSRSMRKLLSWTQDNLAEAASLTTRTIEKLESGKARVSDSTLIQVARAFEVPVTIFQKSTEAEDAALVQAVEKRLAKTVAIPVTEFTNASDFLTAFGDAHSYRIDHSRITDEDVLTLAVELGAGAKDTGEIWDVFEDLDQLQCARDLLQSAATLKQKGVSAFVGRYKQRYMPGVVFNVAVMHFAPKEEAKELKFLLVELESEAMVVND